MKKYLLWTLLSFSIFIPSFASIEDTSIIDELNKNKTPTQEANFKLQTFDTCTDMSQVMSEYIKLYWENSDRNYYWGGIIFDWIALEESSIDDMVSNTSMPPSKDSGRDESLAWWANDNFSETNIQVVWVDESDIIKTDWKNIYYYNDKDNYIYVVSLEWKEIIKKIKVPDVFYSPVLYLGNWKLTIVSGWHNNNYNYDYTRTWIDRYSKTYVIVYDVVNPKSPKLDKLYVVDWSLQESRRIWDYVYVVSNTNFNLPYRYYKTFDESNFSVNKVMPQKIDVSVSGTKANIKSWNVADCNSISYSLPDAETIKQFNLSPSYITVSVIDTKNPTAQVTTNVIAGSNNEIYMSLDNMYLTSYMYQNQDFACPTNARCLVPAFSRGTNTLLHKLNIKNNKISYQDSVIIPWSPLTQYSMDEYKWDFRIITQINNWTSRTNESYANLYILWSDLKLKWSLTKLWEWEQFKSSRYIGEKLFLVTFEQVDPLFVIDVSDSTKPKVLWELKIPWYSTYLHPYDENHLIGLWYDTTENNWGGIVNTWVKVDLYQINYNKTCSDTNLSQEEKSKCDSGDYKWIIVKQLYSKTLGWYGSSSEAQYNPRMFMWHQAEKKLLLPVTLYETGVDDLYTRTDFFQWLVTMTIDKNSWIKEDYQITHINYTGLEKERLEACSKYTTESTTPQCIKLINWEEYCQASKYTYVPKYCYAGAGIWEYLADRSYNYNDSFIKRALWVWKASFAISNNEISSHDIYTWEEFYSIPLK